MQAIPTFAETVALLMKVRRTSGPWTRADTSLASRRTCMSCSTSYVSPFTSAVTRAEPLAQDIKPQNDPERLFTLLHEIISSYADWQTQLAPRLLLGLWHPRFLPYAKSILPYCRRSYIGTSPRVARTYFWDDCDTFSMGFGSLVIYGGAKFVREAHRDGKKVMVWTVNDMDELLEVSS